MAVAAGHHRRRGQRRRGAVQHDRLPRLRPERDLRRRVDRLPVLRADRLRRRGQVRARRLAERQHQRAVVAAATPRTGGRWTWSRRATCRSPRARPIRPQYSSCVNFLGKPSPVEESGGTSQSAPLGRGGRGAGHPGLPEGAPRRRQPTPARRSSRSCCPPRPTSARPPPSRAPGCSTASRRSSWPRGMPQPRPATGEPLRLSSNQLNYVGKPGSDRVLVGHRDQHRRRRRSRWPWPGAGSAGRLGGQAGDGDAGRQRAARTSPTGRGPRPTTPRCRFTVPRRRRRCSTRSIAWPATAAARRPTRTRGSGSSSSTRPGRLAAHSLPQGDGGYGSAQVLHPAAGTLDGGDLQRRRPRPAARPGRCSSARRWRATRPFGTVSPSSLTLTPGAVRGWSACRPWCPAARATQAARWCFATGHAGGGPVSVPVTLRGLVRRRPGRHRRRSAAC